MCVDCVRTAAVGQKCPECAAPDGRSRVITAEDIRRAQHRATPVTTVVLAVAVGIGALNVVAPQLWVDLRQLGAQANVLVDRGEVWRILTATLLHSGGGLSLHLAFNMLALWVLGRPLEQRVGSAAFASLYVAAAAWGGAAFFLMTPRALSAVGASGAISGLFGALLVLAWSQRHTAVGRAMLQQYGFIIALNLALPVLFGGIAWQAHLGGLLAGLVIGAVWERVEGGPRDRAAVRTAIGAGAAALALAAVVLG